MVIIGDRAHDGVDYDDNDNEDNIGDIVTSISYGW